ncbi:hypothetical protein CEXT_47341 [Caerostris extrusa]|uniref:Uncharacterized protein n=1 Tax=Caerostris extrusa TaxID=172846 RepID=A0AAV4MSG0_CAEEX|nr:hypothetical protein CEXT_47341 [Caerostris extrusa]
MHKSSQQTHSQDAAVSNLKEMDFGMHEGHPKEERRTTSTPYGNLTKQYDKGLLLACLRTVVFNGNEPMRVSSC